MKKDIAVAFLVSSAKSVVFFGFILLIQLFLDGTQGLMLKKAP